MMPCSVRLSVRLPVAKVHWRIRANLGFKFRSHFTAHCGRRAACSTAAVRTAAVLLAGGSSRAMLASARLSCWDITTYSPNTNYKSGDTKRFFFAHSARLENSGTSSHSHCTKFQQHTSPTADVTASIVQGSAVGPAAYVVTPQT